jgi:hypothetical protein
MLDCMMQDEADPQHTVLWTTSEWEAWPAGLSKAAARVVFDPLFFFTIFAPFYEVCLNQAWPHMIRNTAVRARYMYALRRTVLVVAQLTAFYYFTATPLVIAMVSDFVGEHQFMLRVPGVNQLWCSSLGCRA